MLHAENGHILTNSKWPLHNIIGTLHSTPIEVFCSYSYSLKAQKELVILDLKLVACANLTVFFSHQFEIFRRRMNN